MIGSVDIIFKLFLFSRFNFSLVILEPFLKFIRYIFTDPSIKVKAVKKLWSAQVIEIRYSLVESVYALCFSLK